MASRRTDGRRSTDRFVDSSDNPCITAQNLEDIDFPGIVFKFVDFAQAKQYLAQDLKNNENFRLHWETAIAELSLRKKPISDEDLMKVSIMAYTLDTQMYKVLNEKCKTIGKSKESWNRFPYKGWYSILAHALYELPTSPGNTVEGASIKCYRGVKKKFKSRENDFLVFNCFSSTSRDKEEAKEFTGEEGGGTLFQFDCIPYDSLGIKKYSKFPDEEEVLLAPWSTFQVGETKQVEDEDIPYTLVKLISKKS